MSIFEARVIPTGTYLLHVRDYKNPEDSVLNNFGYPLWYFSRPTFFILAQTKKDPNNNDFSRIIELRKESVYNKAMEKYGKQVTKDVFNDIVIPYNDCLLGKLQIDVFKVTSDLPVTLLNVKTNMRIEQIKQFNEFVKSQDPSYKTNFANIRPAAIWYIRRTGGSGLIIPAMDVGSTDVILDAPAVRHLGYVQTFTVDRYQEHIRTLNR